MSNNPFQKKNGPEPRAWASLLESHLKESDPELYQELKKDGELKEYCLNHARQAHDESQHLTERGMSRLEADQVAMKHWIYPPSDAALEAGVSEEF